ICGGPAGAGTISAGGACGFGAESSEHLHDSRDWGGERAYVSGDGMPGRENAEAFDCGASAGFGIAAGLEHRDCRCAGRRAQQGHRAPRHQACEHFCHRARSRQDFGLRTGQAASACRGADDDAERDATGEDVCRRAPGRSYESGRSGGDGGIYVAGAGARQGARRADGSVFVWRSALRNGDRRGSVSRRDVWSDYRSDFESRAAGSGAFESRTAREAGKHHQQGAGKGSRPALSGRFGHSHGSETAAARHRLRPHFFHQWSRDSGCCVGACSCKQFECGNRGSACAAACAVVLLAAAIAAYHFWGGSHAPSGPAKITQISQWDKPIDFARLSPDAHTVAFSSPVNGVDQVFVMLASGGQPLQLTSDNGAKIVDCFSPDGSEIYYGKSEERAEEWSVATLGGKPSRVVSGANLAPSPDGAYLFYTDTDARVISRAGKSGLDEEKIYSLGAATLPANRILPYADGNHLLVITADPVSSREGFRAHEIDVAKKTATDLDEIPGIAASVVWADPGNSILFSRTLNGLTNIWKYGLTDKKLEQVTLGTGPDTWPMPDPAGKGLSFVNGKSSGFLTAYNTRAKQFSDIASATATPPAISPDGKRVAYITIPARDRNEVWVADIDGSNKTRLATGESLATGMWSADSARLGFISEKTRAAEKPYFAQTSGRGMQALNWTGGTVQNILMSPDQKTVYLNSFEKAVNAATISRESAEGSTPEKVSDTCGFAFGVAPGGKYLLP